MKTTVNVMIDVHCHILPGVDDGASSKKMALRMAEQLLVDGVETVIATPHQLGAFPKNTGPQVRAAVAAFSAELEKWQLPLKILPGGDVRIEPGLDRLIQQDKALTLADGGKYILLEQPHDLFVPMATTLSELRKIGVYGILSHPERNRGLLRNPEQIAPLINQGCFTQVTAGSFLGRFGPDRQDLAERMLRAGQVHMVATDAHSDRSRRPCLHEAFQRIAELTSEETAQVLCSANPAAVAFGGEITQPGYFSRFGGGLLDRWFFRRAA